MKRVGWKTRWGFYFAAIGSAFGLGNLWRFPFVVGENGGGAFVLIYVLFALIIGLPLLISELYLGKSSRKSVMGASEGLKVSLFGKMIGTKWIGRLPVFISLVVVSYYSVISGWVLHFLMQFLYPIFSQAPFDAQRSFDLLMGNGLLQAGLASVHLIIATVIVVKGVQEGLERWAGALMPAFVLLMVVLVSKTLSLPSAPDALRFLFYPDFSKITGGSLLAALGHVLFTLSLGLGTMVTFGSYLRENEHVPTAAFRITIVDTVLSLVAGLVVFPIALSATNSSLQDPGLLFSVLPSFLAELPGGNWFGVLFFLCLYVASLSASIGLLEVIVSNAIEWKRIQRNQASIWVASSAALLALLPSFSGSLLRFATHHERSLIEILDFGLVNVCLPLVAIVFVVLIGRGTTVRQKMEGFVDQDKIESVALFPYWLWMLDYGLPILFGMIFIAQFVF